VETSGNDPKAVNLDESASEVTNRLAGVAGAFPAEYYHTNNYNLISSMVTLPILISST
jgi:hypothetical protein